MLEDEGFIYFKDIPHTFEDIKKYSAENIANRQDAIINFLKVLNDANVNVVVDRLHISEKIFSSAYRDDSATPFYKIFDFTLSLLNCKLVLMERDIDTQYLNEHPFFSDIIALKTLCNDFRYEFEKSEITNKARYDLAKSNPEYIVEDIVGETDRPAQYDFYLASPFFNNEQVARMNYVKNSLRNAGYSVYAPMEAGVVAAESGKDFVKQIFDSNVEAIKNCEKVLAITDGKDMGTIWEAGYAYGIHKPVIYFAETLGNNPFNIMLSESGKGIFKSHESLAEAIKHNDFYQKEEVKHE